MNCSRAQELMSAYHDDELSEALQAEFVEHGNACATCSEELRQFNRLAEVVLRLDAAEVPEGLWSRIETDLSSRNDTLGRPSYRWWQQPAKRRFAVAASVLLFIGLAALFFVFDTRSYHGLAHSEDVDLAPFARQFLENPLAAQQELLAAYSHRDVTLADAESQLKYRPVVAKALPGGFIRRGLRLIDMPCCTCVQATYQNDDSQWLATFEQSSDASFMFDGCTEVSCECCGVDTRIVQVNGGIAATWATQSTHITLVGARDMAHVVSAIDVLTAETGLNHN